MNFSRPGWSSPPALDTNIYLSPVANEDRSAIHSSRFSQAATDDGEMHGGPMSPVSPVQGITGPVGEPGLPPSRPVAVFGGSNGRTTLGLQGPSQNAQIFNTPFIRGLQSAVSDTFTATSLSSLRPSTSESKSHVPSLTSRAFLTPMSSQKLQAHRGQRPWSMHDAPPSVAEDFDDTRSTTNRNSTGSALTIRGGHALPTQADIDALPRNTASRASTRTDWTDADRSAYPEFVASGVAMESREDVSQAGVDQYGREDNNEHQADDHIPDDRYNIDSKTNGFYKVNGTSLQNGNKPNVDYVAESSESPTVEEKMQSQTAAVKRDLGRNHEYFTGNTVFFWGGRLQNARDRPIVLITAVIVLLPSILFFAFSAPWLWHHVSPAVPLIFAYILFVCMSSFIHASLTDPGILPRNIHPFPPPDPNADPLALGPPTTDWVMVKSAVAQHGAFEVPTKYCKSCNIWRPPRCHHCRVCDNCVETQDHHCMWLNNCVGRRNYRYFFTFVSSGTLIGIYLFAASAGHIWAWKHHYHTTTLQSINHNRVPFAMFIYGLLAFLYPASLWGYHIFLVARGQTTREYLNSNKFAKQDRHRPFNQRPWWKNFIVVLVRPRPPTYLNFKKKYEDGDQRFGERRGKRTTPLAPEQQGGGAGVEMQALGTGEQGFQGPQALRGGTAERTAKS